MGLSSAARGGRGQLHLGVSLTPRKVRAILEYCREDDGGQ